LFRLESAPVVHVATFRGLQVKVGMALIKLLVSTAMTEDGTLAFKTELETIRKKSAWLLW
jgi:hypothetical protein